MKLYNIIFCTLLISTTKVYSQKLEELGDLTIKDFTLFNSGSPSIISYKGLITFPYDLDPNNTGAKDQYFSVRTESVVRIGLNNSDTSQKFMALSKTFEQGIRLKSIKYYYKNGTSLSTRKTDVKDISITSDSIAYYIDFTKIIKDSVSIVDISFNSVSSSKQKIKLYLEQTSLLKEYKLDVYIPEIYFYDTFLTDNCLTTQIEKGFRGPSIGYVSQSGSSRELQSRVLADSFTRMFNTKYEQVFCKTNRITISMKTPCSDSRSNKNKEIINFNLKSITEIQ